MTNYREILRLDSLKINHSKIAASVGCSRQTVISVLQKAKQKGIGFDSAKVLSDKDLSNAINDGGIDQMQYRMPDYEHIHRELYRSGVTLTLLWVEYCDECRRLGQIPYQSTQFNKQIHGLLRSQGHDICVTVITNHVREKRNKLAEAFIRHEYVSEIVLN